MKITTCYSVALKAQMASGASGKQKDADAFSGTMKIDGSLLRATADECLATYRMCLDIFRREWGGIRQAGSSIRQKRHCETPERAFPTAHACSARERHTAATSAQPTISERDTTSGTSGSDSLTSRSRLPAGGR